MLVFNTSKYYIILGIFLIYFMQMSYHLIHGNCIMEKKYCINWLNTNKNKMCIPWKFYQDEYVKIFENTTLCNRYTYGYWCATGYRNEWGYCEPRECNLPDIICKLGQFWTVYRKYIKFDFQILSPVYDLIIIISSTATFSKCSVAAKCHQCQSTEILMNNLFGSCNGANLIKHDINTISIGLPEFSNYIIYILPVVTQQLHGSLFKISITTSEIIPNTPYDIEIKSITTSSMNIQWRSPVETEIFGPPEGYILNLLSPVVTNYKLRVTNKSLRYLKPCKKYCFNIIAFNAAGESIPSREYCIITKPAFDPVSSLSASTKSSEMSILITWKYFNKNECNVKFIINYFNKFQQNKIQVVETTNTNILLQDLSVDQYYIVNVTPKVDDEIGRTSNNFEFHTIRVPKTPSNIRMKSRTANSISIEWNKFENENSKYFNKYEIKQNGTVKALTNDLYYKLNDLIPYTKYCFTISSINIAGKSEESEPFCESTNRVNLEPKFKTIYLIYLFLVLMLIAVMSFFVYKKDYILKKLTRPKMSEIDLKFMDNVDLQIPGPVKPKQSHLKSEVERKLSKKNFKDLCKIAQKYEELNKLSSKFGELLENKSKNRFANILPYDQTRVILKRSPPKSDYINANYIPFIQNINKYEYIASQGPIDDTISDFWQMIWENNVSIIVMLTRTYEEEKFKCLQYWPENIDEKIEFGENNEFQVSIAEEIEKSGFIERKLNIFHKTQNENRVIIHMHMIEWFDYAAPKLKDFESLMFRFQEIVLAEKFDPYLIHCSAGVGRTGTFIVLDRIIRKLMEGIININISEEILEIRKYRKMMVQRASQFQFIHEFLEYFIKTYKGNIDKDQEPIYFNV